MQHHSHDADPGRASARPHGRRLIATAFAAISLATVVGLRLTGGRSDAAGAAQRLGVPAYFWPGTGSSWTAVLDSTGIVERAVVNIESGPGAAKVQAFADVAAQARARGLLLLGYVDTGYGNRPEGDVLADVDRYHTWYGIDAVFLDQVPDDCGHLPYYTAIYAAVHAHVGGHVTLNPGMNPMECVAAVGDVIVNFEGTAATYQSWTPASWTSGYPDARFWHLVYGTPPNATADVVKLSRERRAGLVFVTDDDFPNPWDGVGSAGSWTSLLSTWNPRGIAPVVDAPSTTTVRGAAPVAGPTTISPAPTPDGPPDPPRGGAEPPTTVQGGAEPPTTVQGGAEPPTTVEPSAAPTTALAALLVPATAAPTSGAMLLAPPTVDESPADDPAAVASGPPSTLASPSPSASAPLVRLLPPPSSGGGDRAASGVDSRRPIRRVRARAEVLQPL